MTTKTRDKIGLRTAVAIGMKSMIGAGIFTITALLGSKVGPAGIITYLLAFIAVWFIAQSFARVAYLYPQEGSFYNYARQAGGHRFGLFAAGCYLIGLLIAMGLLCKVAGFYIQAMYPALSLNIINILTVALLIILNIFGVHLSSIGIYILLMLASYSLIMTTALCLSNFNLQNLTPFMPYGFTSVIAGTKVAVFGLFGFESIASLFNIMQNPEKTVPKALKLTILMVGLVYLLFVGSILVGIPQNIFHQYPDSTVSQTLLYVFPQHFWIIQTIGVAILFALLGTMHAMLWSSSQLMLSYFKFLNIKWLNGYLKKDIVNSKTCVIIGGLVILTACKTITNIAVFFSLVDVCILFAFIASIIPLLYLKKEWKSGQNIITILGLITACIIFAEAAQTLLKNIETLRNLKG